MDGVAIRAEGLTKTFGAFTAVDHLSLEVREGEIFGFLGPNGAGKSTTIRLLCTLSRPSSGVASVAGFDIVHDDAEVRKHIGLVSEKLIMYNELTARENLRLFGRLYDLPRDVLNERIETLLRFVRMERWADARVGTFSTGMKQRINVIRAMVNQPEILFLDEPTLGLDPQSTVEIRELIRTINAEQRTTMVLTTHTMVDADMLCDRIGIIDKGRIVALDTPPNLKRLVTGAEFTTFEFDVPDLSPSTIATIGGLSCVVSCVPTDDTHLTVRARGSDAFDSLIDALRGCRAHIASARSLEPTLEDVFLHITGTEALDRSGTTDRTTGPVGHHGPRVAPRVR